MPPEKPYSSLDALLKAEIGVAAEESKRIVKLRANGGDRKSGNYQSNNITLIQRGTAARYSDARLERDYPAIHKQVISGELSAHAAKVKVENINNPVVNRFVYGSTNAVACAGCAGRQSERREG